MKNRTNANRRGFTLAELTVVLAVMTIVAALVITFSSMIATRRAESQARLDAMNDISVAENTIESWIQKNEITKTESNRLSAGENTICAKDGKLFIGENAVYTFERVKKIAFSSATDENGHTLYFCKVAYTPHTDDTEDAYYTFCVYKRGGEIIEAGGGE